MNRVALVFLVALLALAPAACGEKAAPPVAPASPPSSAPVPAPQPPAPETAPPPSIVPEGVPPAAAEAGFAKSTPAADTPVKCGTCLDAGVIEILCSACDGKGCQLCNDGLTNIPCPDCTGKGK